MTDNTTTTTGAGENVNPETTHKVDGRRNNYRNFKGKGGRKPMTPACTGDELLAEMKRTHMDTAHLAKLCRIHPQTLYQYTAGYAATPQAVIDRIREIAKWTNGEMEGDDYTAICMNYIRIHKM